jgi:hypothetical protein
MDGKRPMIVAGMFAGGGQEPSSLQARRIFSAFSRLALVEAPKC